MPAAAWLRDGVAQNVLGLPRTRGPPHAPGHQQATRPWDKGQGGDVTGVAPKGEQRRRQCWPLCGSHFSCAWADTLTCKHLHSCWAPQPRRRRAAGRGKQEQHHGAIAGARSGPTGFRDGAGAPTTPRPATTRPTSTQAHRYRSRCPPVAHAPPRDAGPVLPGRSIASPSPARSTSLSLPSSARGGTRRGPAASSTENGPRAAGRCGAAAA
jgi:hypothetical protein